MIGVLGLAIGLLLGVAAHRFRVETDEREQKIREALPGNNCGGCGYPGCDGCAAAIASGEAPADACPVGGAQCAAQIAEIIGKSVEPGVSKVAYVACSGTCGKVRTQSIYSGISDCRAASVTPGGGERACSYGCMGFGSCAAVCPFDAVHIVDGVAKVDEDKCRACGKCVAICPRKLISLVPSNKPYRVACSSRLRGPEVKKQCEAGCIGCGLCAKNCSMGAITMVDNLPVFDYDKCANCGTCAGKCPVHVIASGKD